MSFAPILARLVQCAHVELRIRSIYFGFGAIEVRLVRPRIDHIKQVAFLDERAGFKVNLGDVSGHSWPYFDRFNRIQSPGEFVPFVYFFPESGKTLTGNGGAALFVGALLQLRRIKDNGADAAIVSMWIHLFNLGCTLTKVARGKIRPGSFCSFCSRVVMSHSCDLLPGE